MCVRAVALWCALALVAGAAAYTVDCNHEYTDCDTELGEFTTAAAASSTYTSTSAAFWVLEERLGQLQRR